MSVGRRHHRHTVVLLHRRTRPFSTETRRNMDLLWEEYFRDPSQWSDDRNSKTNPRSPDFNHKITKESLWIHGWHNPPWVQEELGRRGLQPLVRSTELKDGELCETRKAKGVHYRAQEEKVLINGNDQKFQEDRAVVALLKACAKHKDLNKGRRIHADILERGLLEKNIHVGNNLVNMYAKCGALAKAQEVFDNLPIQNVFSWNALIAGYAQHGQGEEALNCFEWMQREGLTPDAVTFVCILKACGSIGASEKGKKIHAEIIREGLLEKDIVLGTALVTMYAKCGVLTKAQEVFDELPVRDVVSWNVLIAGYAQHGYGEEALNCFEQMKHEGFSPDAVTFACILKACGSIGTADRGKEIHAEIVKEGLLRKSIVVGTALVDMYAKCGALAKAQEVFDELPVRNVVSWSALIAGYAQHGHGEEALNCFERMQCEGITPDAVAFVFTLQACGSIGAADKGKEIHAEIVREGLLEKDIVVGTALVDMYAKCGVLAKAQEVFDELPVRNVVSWNALIGGYAQHGHGKEALDCFERMRQMGLSPNAVTFVCILKSCGSIGAADKGKEIHGEIVREGLLEKNIVVGNALVDMYAKCGVLVKAQGVFDELPARDIISWNALIAGYAQFAKDEIVFDSFSKMIGEGIEPNQVTLTLVLNTCSHSGLVDKGQMYFETMNTRYGIIPDLEHYTCMVDLFGRAGHFVKAVTVIKKMPSADYLPAWNALLGACRKWGNVKLGRIAFDHAVRLDEKDAAAYVCMSNIYAAAGMQDDADKIEAMRVNNKAWKKPGHCWWTDVSGNVHSFLVGDKMHPQSKNIYEKLEDIAHKMSQEGYSPGLHWLSKDITDDAKKDVLCGHSEKLAIACALINTPEGASIHVVKNMRICGDCHFATSLISKIEKRKILVRDANRFHNFEDGKCDCGEYW